MATSRISAHSAQANSVAITTPQAGDLILVFAHRDGSTTAPSLPSGYTSLGTTSGGSGGTSNSARLGFKYSDGTETTSGTWTNATSVAVHVSRGCDPSLAYGAFATAGAASSTLTFPALTLQVTDGTSWVVGFGASRTATDVGTNDPTGMADRSSATDIAVWDTNAGVSSWSQQTATINASTRQIVYTIELVAKPSNVVVDQLVWHVQSQTNGNYETGNNFKIKTANPTRSGNCLVLFISYAYNAARTVTITDNQGSSWPAAAVTRTNNATDLTAKCYVLPNCAAGITTITVQFDAALFGFQYDLTELWGIAQTSPVDVTSSGQPTSPPLAVGSMTTTQANDVVLACGWPGGWGTPYIGTSPTGFRAMTGHRLLAADSWIGFVSMIGLKASAGAVNPTVYMGAPTAESFNMLAVALKTDNTKGSQATGIRVVGIQKMRMNNGTFVRTNFPTWGNLQVLSSSETPSQCSVDAVKDTSNAFAAWTRLNTAGYPQCAYYANSTPHSSNVVLVSNTTNFLHSVLYDVAGAATDSYDTTAYTSGGTVNGPAYVSNAPDITPSTANGLVLGILNFFTGPPDDCDLPSGVVYDCAYHDGMTDLSTMDTGDGYSHFNNPSATQYSFRWHETAVTTTGWFTRAVAFKAPSTASVVAETVTAADAPTASILRAASMPETATAQDSATGTAAVVVSSAEALTPVDSPQWASQIPGTVSEALTTADAPSAATASPATVAESVAISDSVSGANAASSVVAESTTASDTASGSGTTAASTPEIASVVDAPSAASVLPVVVAESGAAADTSTGVSGGAETVAEGVSMADTSSAALVAPVTQAESAALTDAPSASALQSASSIEAGSAVDSVTAATSTSGSVSEAGAGVDTGTATIVAPVAVSESGSAVDSASGVGVLVASRSESASAAETTDGSIAGSVSSVAEAAAASDSPSAIASLGAAVSESASGVDAPSAALTTLALRAESGAAADSSTASLMTSGSTVEAASSADTQSAISGNIGIVAESVSATDTATAVNTALAVMAESASAVDLVVAWYTVLSGVAEVLSAIATQDGAVIGPGGPYRDPRFWLVHDGPAGAVRYVGDLGVKR